MKTKHGYHINITLELMNQLNIMRIERILSGEHNCSLSTIINEILTEYMEAKQWVMK